MNPARPKRGRPATAAVAFVLATVAILVGLGVWQLERRSWKLALIADVERRIHSAPQPVPGPAQWAKTSPSLAPYTRVWIHGAFRPIRPTFVQAVTEKGPGYWVLAPLMTDRGFTVLINRGFVPAEARDRLSAPPPTPVTISGLLRASEPGGAFLHRNAPTADRWYSRDVQAIARSDGLSGVAPYSIDADASPNSKAWPVGGMTVVHFRNAHLSYALTWFALAAMLAGWSLWSVRRPRSTGAAE